MAAKMPEWPDRTRYTLRAISVREPGPHGPEPYNVTFLGVLEEVLDDETAPNPSFDPKENVLLRYHAHSDDVMIEVRHGDWNHPSCESFGTREVCNAHQHALAGSQAVAVRGGPFEPMASFEDMDSVRRVLEAVKGYPDGEDVPGSDALHQLFHDVHGIALLGGPPAAEPRKYSR